MSYLIEHVCGTENAVPSCFWERPTAALSNPHLSSKAAKRRASRMFSSGSQVLYLCPNNKEERCLLPRITYQHKHTHTRARCNTLIKAIALQFQTSGQWRMVNPAIAKASVDFNASQRAEAQTFTTSWLVHNSHQAYSDLTLTYCTQSMQIKWLKKKKHPQAELRQSLRWCSCTSGQDVALSFAASVTILTSETSPSISRDIPSDPAKQIRNRFRLSEDCL